MNSTRAARAALAIAWAGSLAAGCVKGPGKLGGSTPAGGTDGGVTETCPDAVISRANLACDDADAIAAASLLRSMSLQEKVQQLSGPAYNPNNMFDQEDNARLGIPGFKYMDGPRGVRWYNSDYGTTVFPVGAARASTWDLELERLVGKTMAREMRALGRHVLLAPTINQVSHPRWGRAQESYGEDSHLLGEMGAAFIGGAQYDPSVADPADPDQPVESTYRVQACAKHFASNNIEDTRIYVNAVVDDRTLREVYLPHFKKAADAGVSCVMASYNRVNGDYSCYSKPLLRDVLKSEWGYSGYVVSDWFAKGKTLMSPAAGLDIEMPFSSGSFPSMFDSAYFYGTGLTSAVQSGQVDEKLVDEAAMRVLYRKVHAGLTKYKASFTPTLTKSDAAQDLALRAAREGIVLLKNGPTKALADDVLPLSRSAIGKVAVVGMFGNSENMGDKGSSDAKVMDGSLVVTPFEGLRDALPGKSVVTFTTVAGNEAALADADAIVVVAAYYFADLARSTSGEEGEWKDRASLALPARDLANIAAATALKASHPGMKLFVVVKSGGAVVVKDWIGGVDALVMSWYAGMKEGQALAEILLGDANPSGKVCQSFPAQESDLPAFRNDTQGDVAYDYYHGYRWLDRKGIAPAYPFGFGLSYTTFSYANLALASATIPADGTLTATVDVTNSGPVAGSEVVELYVGYPNTAVADAWGRPVKELKAFARVADLVPGETRKVTLTVKASDLAYWDIASKAWKVERAVHQLLVGPSSDASDANMKTATFTIQ
jgi:beta-glucosidase